MTDSAHSDYAISAALSQNWQEAIRANETILKDDPKNVDALNRLGYAYLKIGKPTKAKATFEKVLKLDPYNRIALNNSKKIASGKKIQDFGCPGNSLSPLIFLEEPGKTKLVECVNPTSAQILSTLSCGQEVYLKPKKHGIDIRDGSGNYIGALPDDLAFKLQRYITGGNAYHACIKRVGKGIVSVFLREVRRGKKFTSQPSFITSVNYAPSSREETAVEEKPDTRETGDDEG
jgi:tetratricopeptide (TPR) repeat protein